MLTCDLAAGVAGVVLGTRGGGGTLMLMLPLLSLCMAMPDSSDTESCTKLILVVARLSRGWCDAAEPDVIDAVGSLINFITGASALVSALTSSALRSRSSSLSFAILRITLVGVNAGFNVACQQCMAIARNQHLSMQ